jgi:hypothetical protein
MDWKVIYGPIVVELLREVVLPILGGLLLTVGTAAGLWLQKNLKVDVTLKLNDLLHRALDRGAEALVSEYLNKGLPVPIAEVATKLAKQVQVTNADTLKGLKNPTFSTLEKLARQAIERKGGSPTSS